MRVRTAVSILAASILALVLAGSAQAGNTRVSIADFQWSDKTPHVDLGESVIWTWTGPDTQHSVTGQAPNEDVFGPDIAADASRWDSDFGIREPQHTPGDEYRVTFTEPGTYVFQCKLHSVVRGSVTVSDSPGDPDSDPGPPPKINYDAEAPHVDNYFFTRDGNIPAEPSIGFRGRGIGLSFALGEGGTAMADYYRLDRRGRGGRARTVRVYRGYDEWNAHVGLNTVGFAARTGTFRPAPGRYVALFRVKDPASNFSPDIPLRFTIKPRKK